MPKTMLMSKKQWIEHFSCRCFMFNLFVEHVLFSAKILLNESEKNQLVCCHFFFNFFHFSIARTAFSRLFIVPCLTFNIRVELFCLPTQWNIASHGLSIDGTFNILLLFSLTKTLQKFMVKTKPKQKCR